MTPLFLAHRANISNACAQGPETKIPAKKRIRFALLACRMLLAPWM